MMIVIWVEISRPVWSTAMPWPPLIRPEVTSTRSAPRSEEDDGL